MRLRNLLFGMMLVWLLANGGGAQAGEPATVDPFLQAAQWAEKIPLEEGAKDPDFEANGELVACGDEVGMAGMIEPDPSRRGRWSVLTELPVLLPSYSTSTLATANDHPIIGPRISLGWESANGFGIRGRAWGFDTTVDVEGQPLSSSNYDYFYYYSSQIAEHQLDFRGGKFDLDFYKRITHQTGDFAFGATVTAAQLSLSDQYLVNPYSYAMYNRPLYIASYYSGSKVRNRGGGLGLLAEGSHRFFETPVDALAVVARGRIAYLIGRWEDSSYYSLPAGDGNMAIGEAALGLEYRRKLGRADLIAQCLFEVQSWDVSHVGRVNFAGVTPGIGLNW